MKGLLITILILLLFSPRLFAFSDDQLDECILGVKQAPILVGAPKGQIEEWCKCTLKLIEDDGLNDMKSASFCGHKIFK